MQADPLQKQAAAANKKQGNDGNQGNKQATRTSPLRASEMLSAARLASPLNAMQNFRKDILFDLSPQKEAKMTQRVKEMLRMRGESSNTGLAVVHELRNVLNHLQNTEK